jgi:ABC-type nitrate/sulfonate/bicarbonate transport system permease component
MGTYLFGPVSLEDYMNPHKEISRSATMAYGAIGVMTVVLLWCALSFSGMVSPAKLPNPLAVLNKWVLLAYSDGESQLLVATVASLKRILISGFLMVATGVPIGIAMGASKKVNAFFSPLVDPFRSAPIVAFIPIFVMWLGIGETMRIAFLWLGAVVYLIPMVRDAVVAVDEKYFKLAKDRGANDFEALFLATMPAAMPRVADGVITSFALMWTYITVVEMVNADTGLGKLAENYRKVSQIDAVFAIILTILILSLAMYSTMMFLRNKRYTWVEV